MPRGVEAHAARPFVDSQADVVIPDKLYFRIAEVSKLTQTKAYVLRYWETEYPTLKPMKSKSGHRQYRRQDIEMILEIKRLLYERGYTIGGARRQLAGHRKSKAEQKHLFQSTLGAEDLKAIRRELQTVLTILSRKC
jgi:DNA-binding transcriptional MerR regulator